MFNFEDCRLGNLEVEVGAYIHAVEAVAALIAAAGFIFAEKVAFVQEIDGSEVFYHFCTAADVDVGVVGHCGLLEESVGPVDVGIAFGFFEIGGIAVFFDYADGSDAEPGFGLETEFALDNAVTHIEGFGRTFSAGELRGCLDSHVDAYGNLGASFATALGGDEDNAVGAFHTVDCGGGCVLEYGYRLYGTDVDR